MPTFQKCPASVKTLAANLLAEFDSHQPLLETKAAIDYVFAYADIDDDGQRTGDAIVRNGVKCLGLTRALSLKDRVLGRGDAEITLDGDWWSQAGEQDQRALLDHELHHLSIKQKRNQFQYDDIGRPLLKLRKHDFEFGWFRVIAERHGQHSMEQQQAARLMDAAGQYFWPALAANNPLALAR